MREKDLDNEYHRARHIRRWEKLYTGVLFLQKEKRHQEILDYKEMEKRVIERERVLRESGK